MDLDQLLKEAEQEQGRLHWEGTFAQYLPLVTENPSLARRAHERLDAMVLSHGVESDASGHTVYYLFQGQLFGLDPSLQRLMRFFASAARSLAHRRRLPILVGPPGSGKSTIVTLLKRGLEADSRTDEGALYAIKGCPMQEDPLHLAPTAIRAALESEHGLSVEGNLCPQCRSTLRTQYQGRIADMPVRRVLLSEAEATGIGTFDSLDGAAHDPARLVGGVDASQWGPDRHEAAGHAYRLDGVLNVANRGLVEFGEVFKAPEGHLSVLLGLVQEEVIKLDRFGSVDVDEVVIGQGTPADLARFLQEGAHHSLRDRMVVIPVPYALRVQDEVAIYQRMVEEAGFSSPHRAPLALPAAASFAVLSRLVLPTRRGMSLLDKLHLYDGDVLLPYTASDVAALRQASPDEGMDGISPRYGMNRLSAALAQGDGTCLTPLAALRSLAEGLEEHPGLAAGPRERHFSLLQEAVSYYSGRARHELQRALREDIQECTQELLHHYWTQAQAFCEGRLLPDPETGEERPPDEEAMRRVEEALAIPVRGRERFRREVVEVLDATRGAGLAPDFTNAPRLQIAAQRLLLPGELAMEAALFPSDLSPEERAEARDAILQHLIQRYGYCRECAADLYDYVGFLLRGGRALRVTRAGRIRWEWPPDLVMSPEIQAPVDRRWQEDGP